MRIIVLTIIVSGFLANASRGQVPVPAGQYVFEKKREMFSTYVFSHDSLFLSILSGDMGTFYGKGKFKIKNNKLILNFDSSGVAKSLGRGYYITPTGSDTLTILNIRGRKFDLECDYTGQIETYKRETNRPKREKK